MYWPLAEIVPPEADQVTAVLLEPETAAVNCCCPPVRRLAAVGVTETWVVPVTGGGGFGSVTVTSAESEATTVEFDLRRNELRARAVTVKDPADAGAVKRPALLMVPADAVHVTVGLFKPLTTAANCCCCPSPSEME